MEKMEAVKKHLFALILCGGGGTRLWPRSRNKFPKQFARLTGKESIFQLTAKRFGEFISWDRIFVVTTTADYGRIVQKQVPKIPKKNIIVEPMRRNTAIAHGLGAVYIKKIDPEAVILNESADHPIQNLRLYQKTLLVASQVAYDGDWLVAVGIKPDYPHTGMGHIKAKKVIKRIDKMPIYKVESFTEKPDLTTAKKFTESGHYFWNANEYVWRADTILEALRKHEPEIGKGLERIEAAVGRSDEKATIQKVYQQVTGIAIDYAVSERAKNFLMVEGKFGWVDIGDWKVVYDESKKDKDGNVVIQFGKRGEFIGINTRNSLIHFDDQLIAAVDVEGMVIIDTKDALLICPKEKAEEVKKLVQKIKKLGKNGYL